MKKILIFGGSFDPVHNGHTAICRHVQKVIKPQLTLVVPNKIPPLKDNETLASPAQRLQMAKIAFGNIKNTEICDYEVKNKKNQKSYTVNTLEYFHKKYPDGKFYLMIGMDRFHDFKNWKSPKRILQLVEKVIVVARNGVAVPKDNEKNMFIPMPIIDISSKSLRDKIIPSQMDKKVLQYIFENKLYLEHQLRNYMSEYRLDHSRRVAKTAVTIAQKHNPSLVKKAYLAGIYHDICKELKDDKIIELVGSQGSKYPNTHTKHGIAGAIFLKKNFLMNDKLIFDAIKYHVIPPAKCHDLTKIIYCADKLEPKRKSNKAISNRVKYNRMARTNLDLAFRELLKETKKKYK